MALLIMTRSDNSPEHLDYLTPAQLVVFKLSRRSRSTVELEHVAYKRKQRLRHT